MYCAFFMSLCYSRLSKMEIKSEVKAVNLIVTDELAGEYDNKTSMP